MLGMPTNTGQDMSGMDGQVALAAPMMGMPEMLPQQQVVYAQAFPQGAMMMPVMSAQQGAMMIPNGYASTGMASGMPMMMMPNTYPAGMHPAGAVAAPMMPAEGYVMPGMPQGYMMTPDGGVMPVLPQEAPQAGGMMQQMSGASHASGTNTSVARPNNKGSANGGFGHHGGDRGFQSNGARGGGKGNGFNNDRGGRGGQGGNRFGNSGNQAHYQGNGYGGNGFGDGVGGNRFNNAAQNSNQISSSNRWEMQAKPRPIINAGGEMEKSGGTTSHEGEKNVEDVDNAFESAKCHLFLGGLASSASDSFVRELFKNEGLEIENLKIPVDRATGHPKGYAFVNLADPSQNSNAIKSLSGRNIGGREIIVEESSGGVKGKGKGKGMDNNARPGGKNTGGKGSWGKNQLPWGGWPITNWSKGGAANGSNSRGKAQGWDPSGFGGIYAPIALNWAAQQLWGADGFFGRGKGFNLHGKHGVSAPRAVDPNKLFVGNLSPDASEEDVRREMGAAGEVQSVRILDGKLSGCGFVEFRESKSVTEAIQRLQGVEICGRPVRLERQGGGRGGLLRQTSTQGGNAVAPSSANGENLEEIADDAAGMQTDLPEEEVAAK